MYSDKRGNGMTTSSFILKARVCLAMAAIRPLSPQKRPLSSLEIATKPSPLPSDAKRQISEQACATVLSSSPDTSINNTTLGRSRRVDLLT